MPVSHDTQHNTETGKAAGAQDLVLLTSEFLKQHQLSYIHMDAKKSYLHPFFTMTTRSPATLTLTASIK